VKSTVARDDVFFDSEGDRLAGHLFRPAGAGRLPAVVVTGSWLTVKEQMADRYAQRLAEQGFVALSFDFAGFGQSEGQPREVESPVHKSRDIHHAVTFLRRHEAVDSDRIGALAICASSGYAAANAVSDVRIRSLALVAPWLHDAGLVEAIYGGPDGVADRIEAAQKARARYDETGEVDYVPAASRTDPTAAMYGAFDYYLDADRGAVAAWPNRHAVMAWTEWLTFDPIPLARRITAPTLMVHSESAALPDGARRFHDGLSGPKEIVWLTGGQFDFYDQEPQVTQAVSLAARHFDASLGRA
jgi:fermentation-respiration switch protein FrsA (DUF1100 family)